MGQDPPPEVVVADGDRLQPDATYVDVVVQELVPHET